MTVEHNLDGLASLDAELLLFTGLFLELSFKLLKRFKFYIKMCQVFYIFILFQMVVVSKTKMSSFIIRTSQV